MRILALPRVKRVDGSSSMTIRMVTWLRNFLRLDKSSFVHMAVHSDFSDKSWLKNYGWTDTDLERIELLIMDGAILGSPKRARMMSYTYANALMGQVGPLDEYGKFTDVILSDTPMAIPSVRAVVQGKYVRSMDITVPCLACVIWVPVTGWIQGHSAISNEFDATLEAHGILAADKIIYGSPNQQQDFSRYWAKNLNASRCRDLQDRATLCSPGVETGLINWQPYKEGPITAMWSGYEHEDFYECLNVLLKAKTVGAIDEIILSFVQWPESDKGKAKLEELKEHSYITIIGQLPRDEYWSYLEKAHIFLTFAIGSYGIRWGEMLTSGMLPVIGKCIHDTFLKKSFSDYPFVVSGERDLFDKFVLACKYLKKHTKKALEMLTLIRDILSVEHSIETQSKKIYDQLCQCVTDARANSKYGPMPELINKALAGIDEVTHKEAIDRISVQMDNPLDLTKHMMFPPRFLRWAILSGGFEDIGGVVPSYRRIS